MRFGAAHAIILTAIIASVIGTFFASNAITGFTIAKEGVEKGDFAAVTGKAIDGEAGQANGFRAVSGSVLFGLLSIAALVVVARIGQNAITTARQNETAGISGPIKKAEEAIEAGNHAAAYALYSSIREQYSKLAEQERAKHYRKIMKIHQDLAQQAAIIEAQHLTDKYVNGTITQDEFERLKNLIASQ